jgi:signal transduction histidine kinase
LLSNSGRGNVFPGFRPLEAGHKPRNEDTVGSTSIGQVIEAPPRGFLPRVVPSDRRIRAYLIQLCFVVVAYYAAAHIGYAFRFSGPVASIVWLPVGVGIAALYLLGPRLWPGVVIGDLLVNNYSTLPLGSAIAQSFGNLLEVLIAALLLRRFASRYAMLGSISGFGGLLLALMTGTVLSATVGTVSAVLGNVVGVGSLSHVWRTWWLGDLCGALIVVPLALAWLPPPPRPWFDGRRVELTLALGVLVGLTLLGWRTSQPMGFLALPALTWAALRFGPRGGTLAIAIGAALTVWATTHYIGPFAFRSVNRSVLDTQVYLAVSAVATLCVAALARERERLAEGLRASRARIVTATDVERRRIERNIHDGAQQRLVALSVQLTLAEQAARTRPQTAPEAFASARGELQLAVEELRELVHGIRPQALRRFGLASAVRLAAARSNVPVELGELPEDRLDETAESTAYYVALEAITNAQRYAGPSTIRISARRTSRGLYLQVADDGIGGAVERPGRGLQGLRDRVEAIGGSFRLESASGRGTRLAAEIPAGAVGNAG